MYAETLVLEAVAEGKRKSYQRSKIEKEANA